MARLQAALEEALLPVSPPQSPIPATLERVEDEKERIASVARQSCPLRVVLERVVATPGGTVLACWQLANGTDPARLRRELRAALPEAPAKQVGGRSGGGRSGGGKWVCWGTMDT